jgi:hypothetical protein
MRGCYGRDVLISGRILPDSLPGCVPGGRDLGRQLDFQVQAGGSAEPTISRG